MKKIDVLYLYEKATRELDVACAVKFMLYHHHGLNAEIIQQNYGWQDAFKKFAPKLILLPFCYQERSHNHYLMKWRKSIYFNLSWEQLFYAGNKTAKTPRGEFACNHVIHHAWGDFYHHLLKQQGVPEKHVFINGNPAYTLYEAPYRHYFLQRNEIATRYALDPSRRWVFFPENYNWAFYEKPMLDQMIKDGQPEGQVYAMRDFAFRSFEEVIKWCEELTKNRDLEVIIRPRPATLLTDFRFRVLQIIGRIPERMHLIQKESVREWIMACDIAISSYSTSLIEASIDNKPAYMLEPYPIPDSLSQQWHGLIPHIKTRQDFIGRCCDKTDGTVSAELKNWARSAMMSKGDAIKNLTNFIAKICRHETPIPSPTPIRSIISADRGSLPYWLKYPLKKLSRQLKIYIREPKIHPEYIDDVMLQASVPDRVKKWEMILK